MPKRIGILFATIREVPEILHYDEPGHVNAYNTAGADIGVLVSGIGGANASEAMERLCAEFRPDYVISSGICGGTQADTNIGDLLVADRVLYNNHEILLACPELERMIAFLTQHSHFSVGKFQTFDHLVTAETYVRQDVIGVDVESYGAATAAQRHGTPLAIVRAVSDLVFTGEFLEEHFAIARENLGLFFQAYFRHLNASQNL
ncbi:hypothetical protein HYV82_00575 [Candidatus Woesearchaeota archaeon]|nr:hypothetical protein [Candidatus Woesearchaeota archaeon]